MDMKLRFVDTAGFEGDQVDDSDKHTEKKIMSEMIRQTRNALIYSDLALLVLDGK